MNKQLQFLVLCYLVTCGNTCSMLTHIEVATRTQFYFSFNGFEQFKDLIPKHLSTYQAGATFPDWGYPRNGYHQASEIAHWPPFYRAASEYLYNKYPQPWSEEGERLAVFLVGAATHMVADVAWHSLLNVTNGFILSMSCFGFNCNYDAAHAVADLGGDTVLAVQNDLSYILKNWSIPIADISEIYKIQGWKNVTELVLLESLSELYAGTIALLEGGAEVLYPKYNSVPGFLQDQFEDYFMGGLDDMAVWNTYCLPNILSWILEGPGPNPTICRLMDPALNVTPSFLVPEWRFTRFPAELNEKKANIMKKMQQEVVEGKMELSSAIENSPSKARKSSIESSSAEKTNTIYSQMNYAYLGYDVELVDLNQDNISDLIVSAPGYSNATIGKPQMGCVYIIFGSASISWPPVVEIESIADLKLCGNSSHDRFGHSLSVLDFNADGILDIAIGSPNTNSSQMGYQGMVNVFFGSLSGNKWQTTSDSNITLLGTYYSNFGFKIISGDVNLDGYEDLIIGSPYAPSMNGLETGFVAIYFSSNSNTPGSVLPISAADVMLEAPFRHTMGVLDHGWWGSALLYVSNPIYKFPYLVVGGAGNVWLNSSSFLAESGSLSIYVLDGGRIDHPLGVFYGEEYQQVGAQITIGSMPDLDKTNPILAVSLPLAASSVIPQAGRVVFLSFTEILNFMDKFTINSTNWIVSFSELESFIATTIEGNQIYARFGSAIGFASIVEANVTKETFFVGYPQWTWNSTEQGCVCMWESGSFPHGSVIDPIQNAKRVFTSPVAEGLTMGKDARFGSALDFGDMNGDGNTDIVIASVRKSLYSYLGGSIEIVFR